MANIFKNLAEKLETDEAKKRRLFLEKLSQHKNEAYYSPLTIGKELNYDYLTSERITDYWADKGYIRKENCEVFRVDINRAEGTVGPGETTTECYLKITDKGIDEVEKHWFKRLVDNNKDFFTVVLAGISLIFSFIAIILSIISILKKSQP